MFVDTHLDEVTHVVSAVTGIPLAASTVQCK